MRSRTIRWALVVGAVGLAIGGVVAWIALSGGGSGTVLVSAEDPSDPGSGDQSVDLEGDQPPGSVGGERPADAEQYGSLGSSRNGSADPGQDETTEPQRPTPDELSTGPILEWAEYEPGIAGLSILQPVGDGRVLARAWSLEDCRGELIPASGQVFVTSNGIDWTEVPMPDGLRPDLVNTSGDRWIVAGQQSDCGPFGYAPFELWSSRVFFSDDQGAIWTELVYDIGPDPVPSSPWMVEQSAVIEALMSGSRIVLAVINFETIDAQALLEDRGLLPEGHIAAFWGTTRDGKAEFTLLSSPDPEDPAALPGDEQHLELSVDELGLTPDEQAKLDSLGNSRISVLTSDGSTVELVAQYDGLGATGFATGGGFELTIVGERELLVLTSADGLTWSEQQSSWADHPGSTVVAGATVWRTVSDRSDGFSVERGDDGQTPATVATFEGLVPAGEPVAGPAGAMLTAFVAGGGTDGGTGGPMPEGRVAKDGYELRYNEPEGGVTLWDLTEDAPVYEFGPEDVASDTVPDGVREIDDDESFAVVFEDPETGGDLVTFTDDDLSPIFEATMPYDTYESPEQWLGWSADGSLWGWQTLVDAFGIDDDEGEPWVQLAVGGDFVIAQVQTFPWPELSGDTSGQSGVLASSSSEPLPPRWFIARVP